MHQVTCFGEILWDNFIDGKKPGGAPMNVALHLLKQGCKSTLISSVGKDENGEELKRYLVEQKLNPELIQEHPNLATGIVEVNLDVDQQAVYTIIKPVAWDEIQYSEHLDKIVSSSDALVFGSLACRDAISRNTLFRLLSNAKLKVCDMNLRSPHYEPHILVYLMNSCDILKINEDELLYLSSLYQLHNLSTEERLKQLSKLTKTPTICLTLGGKGAMVLHKEKIFAHSGFKIELVDTVGAGDAFLATFISGVLSSYPIEQSLENACAAGALVASKRGANPDYSIQDIITIIKA